MPITIVICFLGVSHTKAQQEWVYTQFAMNLFDCNGAYAGQHETPSFGLRHRQQWTGIEGRPISVLLSAHLPIAKNRMGVGFRLLNEHIGARQVTHFSGSGVYRLRLRQSTLNFAIILGLTRMGVDWSKLNVMDPEDAQVTLWSNARWSPNIGAAAFYSRKNWYAGLEAMQLNNANFEQTAFVQRMQLKGVLGYHQKVRTDDQLQLAMLGRWSAPGIWQVEGNVMYLKNNKVGLGAGYRSGFGALVLAQVHFNALFRLGLSYDFSTQATQQLDDRSFEVFLGYTMQRGKTKSIRYL